MNEYEITLEYVGKGKEPEYIESEYGFGMNPPIVIRAENKKEAIRQLKLPGEVHIKKVQEIPLDD